MDLTDLETFGESVLTKTPKTQIELPECVKEQKDLGALPSKRKTSTENLSAAAAEINQDNAGTTEGTPQQGVKKTKRKRQDSTQSSAADLPHKGDSDDEKLVIDDGLSPASTPTERPPSSSGSPSTPVPESIPDTLGSPSPQKAVRQNRQPKKAKTGDQLGEILRMQTAMFNSSNSTKKCSSISHEVNSPSQAVRVYSHPTSLVKTCVSSYLERNQNQDAENFTTPQKSESAANIPATEHKSEFQINLLKHLVTRVFCVNNVQTQHIVFVQKYSQKSCRLVQKMNRITRLQTRVTSCTSSTVCRTCWSWFAARFH